MATGSAKQIAIRPRWGAEAACLGMPVEMFHPVDLDSAEAESCQGSRYRLHQLNMERMETAKEVCDRCPIAARCLAEAEELDLYWSMRGGQIPVYLQTANKKKRGIPSLPREIMPDLCRYGHESWGVRQNGERFCRTCYPNRIGVDDE